MNSKTICRNPASGIPDRDAFKAGSPAVRQMESVIRSRLLRSTDLPQRIRRRFPTATERHLHHSERQQHIGLKNNRVNQIRSRPDLPASPSFRLARSESETASGSVTSSVDLKSKHGEWMNRYIARAWRDHQMGIVDLLARLDTDHIDVPVLAVLPVDLVDQLGRIVRPHTPVREDPGIDSGMFVRRTAVRSGAGTETGMYGTV